MLIIQSLIIYNLKITMKEIIVVAVLFTIYQGINAYSVSLAMATLSGSSITNYYQNLAICSCDVTVNLCDNYCCCDSACSQSSTTSWSTNYQCITSSSLQNLCNQNSQQDKGSFSDLACIYYNNQGNIGYYYQYPTITSINYPSTSLLQNSIQSSSSISSQSISSKSIITSAVNSLTLASSYTFTNQYLKTAANQYLLLPLPGVGGRCFSGTINITTSGTYYCTITPTTQNCANINNDYLGTFSICLKGDCSSLSSSSTTINPSLISGIICTNIIKSASLTLVVVSSGNTYILSSASLSVTQSGVNLGTTSTISVSVSASLPTSFSGNPGYQVGKNIVLNSNLYSIENPSTGSCYTVGSTTSSTIVIPFGLNQILSCNSPSPCSSSYYIDSISQSAWAIQKYGSKSSDTITVGGTGATVNTCGNQRIILNVIYSQDGWDLDPQYYITGSWITSISSPQKTITTKYFEINWIYVDPSFVSTPPSNSFYTYFNYLWTPLKQKFGLN